MMNTGLLEVSALAELGCLDEASQRAAFWMAVAKRQGQDEEAEMFHALEAAPVNAFRGEGEVFDAPVAATAVLEEIIDTACRGPLPEALFETWPSEAGSISIPHVLLLPSDISQVEAAWFDPTMGREQQASVGPQWLQRHPRAFDSLAIIEDLLELLEAAQGVDTGPLLQRLDDRRLRLAEHYLAALPDTAELPWGWLENRPLLRALLDRALDIEDHDPEAAVKEMQHLNKLCPNDNQGIRLMLINRLLSQDRNREAQELADQYPDDFSPDIAFGKVLALVRLGRVLEAETALREAHARLPRVIDYLVPTSKQPPKLDHYQVTIGGPDQAWWYRDDMRGEYVRTRGMLEWLKTMQGRIKAGR